MTLRSVSVRNDAPDDEYPFGLAAVAGLPLELDPQVTVLVGENGSGKSTLVEAIAVAAGLNPEGGSRNAVFTTAATHSPLADHIDLRWRAARRLDAGYFLRAESFYNVATDRDHLPGPQPPSYHERSHGEAFLDVAATWFAQRKLFVLDEPESGLSFSGQLQLIAVILDGVRAGGQFIIATHSPLLMAIPNAAVHALDVDGIHRCAADELDVVARWREFLSAPDRFLRHLD